MEETALYKSKPLVANLVPVPQICLEIGFGFNQGMGTCSLRSLPSQTTRGFRDSTPSFDFPRAQRFCPLTMPCP